MIVGRSFEMWSDVALLTGGWTVCGCLLLVIANHWITLTGMADDIALQRKQLAHSYQAASGRISEVLARLRDQIFWQRTALVVTGITSIIIAVFITFVVANRV